MGVRVQNHLTIICFHGRLEKILPHNTFRLGVGWLLQCDYVSLDLIIIIIILISPQ